MDECNFHGPPTLMSYMILPAPASFLHLQLQLIRPFCTIHIMVHTLEADIALLHIAGGGARITPPPGTLAQTAPRRAARGRKEEMLLINLRLHAASPPPPGLIDHLAGLVAKVYFGTPGSVTYALREAAAAFNDHLIDNNQDEKAQMQLQGHLMIGVLRGDDLYLAQCGVGQTILVRPGQVTHLTSDEATSRPLGFTLAPHVRYHHLQVETNDLLILTTFPPPLWSDTTLSGLSALNLEQVIDRLVAASNQDLTGLLARIVPHGKAIEPLAGSTVQHPTTADYHRLAQQEPRTRSRRSNDIAQRTFFSIRQFLSRTRRLMSEYLSSFVTTVSNLIARMAPGIAEPVQSDTSPPALLAATAVIVPLLIVAIAAVVYFGRGRQEQFQEYLIQASAAIQVAQMKQDSKEARGDWETAIRFLDMAANYGKSQEADIFRQQAQTAVDSLDLVNRVDFLPVVSGGFGLGSNITALAASATDLYVLDAANHIIWHAWGAPERGYEIDKTFECLKGKDSFPDMGTPVDIVIQSHPGALGAEGTVAVDKDGTLLYCAPDRQPAIAQLANPDIGWGRIQAIDVYGDSLYVMDTETNAIYIYNASGGLFSGTPTLFFVEEVRDLSGAIDLAMAQDELLLLYADGQLDRCRRSYEPPPEGGVRIRVECEDGLHFQDERPGYEATTRIPSAIPIEMAFSPPPEPSLFFLDTFGNRVFHYSMRLVYQAQFVPLQPFEENITALTLGPPNDLFVAVGSQVYHAQPVR